MPAVVRVKRRIDEEPLSAFVLNGKKRRRLEDGDVAESAESDTAGKDEISTILKFAGTIKEQDDTATTQLVRLTKEAARELVQQKTRKSTTSHTERARQEMRQSLHEQRFRVVNCMRTTLGAEGAATATSVDYDDELNANPAKQITIVDIEKQSASTSTTNTITEATASTTPSTVTTPELVQPSDSDTGYVYDLYLPENEQQAAYVDLMDDNYLSVRAFDDLIYEDRYNNTDDEENDSEDSNQENYFANDYPDEDAAEFQNSDDESEGTREIRHVVEKFVFEDDDEDEEAANTHSSDDEDYNIYQDPYVHTVDVADVAGGFVDDVDYCDVADRYGLAYARYKARVLKSLQHNAQENDDDDKGSDKDTRSDSSNEHFHSASENED